MKKICVSLLAVAAIFAACDKEKIEPASFASLVVVQASPTASTGPTDTVNVFINDSIYTTTNLYFNSISGYFPVATGTQRVDITRGLKNTGAKYVATTNYNFERAKAYSFWVYDTTTSATGQAKLLKLKDDLTLPAAGKAHMRFLHLNPTAGTVDVTFVRTSATPNDSITLANVPYVGSAPNEAALSAFTAVNQGSYTVKVKTPGTQTVLTSGSVVLTTGANISNGRITTIYFTGGAKGRSGTIGSFRHY